jgi:hypothetical protein
MPRPLKVYRAHIGFFDTIVAAHSQKEALVAWGGSPAESRQGFVSVTNDVKAMTAALKYPGVVLYRPFGSDGQFSPEPTLPDVERQLRREARVAARETIEKQKRADADQKHADRERAAQEKAEQKKAEPAKAREEKLRLERERQLAREQAKSKLDAALEQIDQEKRELDRRRAEARAEYDAALSNLRHKH